MNYRLTMLGLVTLGVAALHGASATAQERTGSQEVQVYAGEMFGDRLTGLPLGGRYPVVDDDAVFGGSYTYDFTDQWGLQLSAGYVWSDLNHPLYGVTGTTPVVLTDSNGYTANAGLGVKYYLTDNFFIDFDARYRYLSRLINTDRQGLNTAQTTLSLGYQF